MYWTAIGIRLGIGRRSGSSKAQEGLGCNGYCVKSTRGYLKDPGRRSELVWSAQVVYRDNMTGIEVAVPGYSP